MSEALAAEELVAWAMTQARRYIEPLGDRWLHTRAVATLAGRLSFALSGGEKWLLMAAACLHDVGYAPQLERTGFHPLDGALYLRRHGHEELAGLVAYHTGARHEAALRGLDDQLAEFTPGDPTVAAFVTYCDITTGPKGQAMTPRERVEEVAARYGLLHPVTRGLLAAWPELDHQIETAQHLRARAAFDQAEQLAAQAAARPPLWTDPELARAWGVIP